jgi:hypothetical protein
MTDNYFKGCPAKMQDGRILADYRTATRREQYIKTINGFDNDNDYRWFLQNNADAIMDNEWTFYRKNFSCYPQYCFHNTGTRTTSQSNIAEMTTYNNIKTGKPVKVQPICESYDDSRLNK